MQQMHQGQIPGSTNSVMPQSHVDNEPSSLDDLISGASKQAEETAKAQATAPASVNDQTGASFSAPQLANAAPEATVLDKKPIEEQGEEKVGKKDKDKSKASRLVYADNEVSPEEKMAALPRYATALQKVTV